MAGVEIIRKIKEVSLEDIEKVDEIRNKETLEFFIKILEKLEENKEWEGIEEVKEKLEKKIGKRGTKGITIEREMKREIKYKGFPFKGVILPSTTPNPQEKRALIDYFGFSFYKEVYPGEERRVYFGVEIIEGEKPEDKVLLVGLWAPYGIKSGDSYEFNKASKEEAGFLEEMSLEELEDLIDKIAKKLNEKVEEVRKRPDEVEDLIREYFQSEEEEEEEEVEEEEIDSESAKLVKSNKQVVFYGPPGTGKTFNAKKVAKELLRKEDFEKDPRFKLVVFHPAFEYEQFIRGLRPFPKENGIEFCPVEGHFLKMCWRALFLSYRNLKEKKSSCKEHKLTGEEVRNIVEHTKCIEKDECCVLIIDEINRGNVPLLFGELVYGIEKDKRGTKIDLPYEMRKLSEITDDTKEFLDEILPDELSKDINEKKEFWEIFQKDRTAIYIPHNLYLIATMNTSDRSIGTIDAAIRRRFAFKYVGPDKKLVKENLKELFKDTNNLFKEEGEEEIRVGGIGHSYFMEDKEIANQIEYYVIPLLREYVELGIAKDKTSELIEKIEKWKKIISSPPSEETQEKGKEGEETTGEK